MRRRLAYLWYKYIRRRRTSRPGVKLDGSNASDPISCLEVDEDERNATFTWSDGSPDLKSGKKYWLVLKSETPAQEAGSTYAARKIAPAKGGEIEYVQIGCRKIGNSPGSLSAEIWTNVDEALTWEHYREEEKCKTPNS